MHFLRFYQGVPSRKRRHDDIVQMKIPKRIRPVLVQGAAWLALIVVVAAIIALERYFGREISFVYESFLSTLIVGALIVGAILVTLYGLVMFGIARIRSALKKQAEGKQKVELPNNQR